jgi:hypothetical protein
MTPNIAPTTDRMSLAWGGHYIVMPKHHLFFDAPTEHGQSLVVEPFDCAPWVDLGTEFTWPNEWTVQGVYLPCGIVRFEAHMPTATIRATVHHHL